MKASFKIEGLKEVLAAFEDLADEIGDRKATGKILVPAVREAMKPVLSQAIARAPVDTGGLRLSLQVEARRPTKRDRRSKYITQTDTVIGAVTTASGKKLAQMSQGKGLANARKRLASMDSDAHVGAFRANKFQGVTSDARAIAQEFGTANHGAQPFLRTAMETQAPETAKRLGDIIGRRLNQYKAKYK
jgi:HK97 gp10 family phage protein